MAFKRFSKPFHTVYDIIFTDKKTTEDSRYLKNKVLIIILAVFSVISIVFVFNNYAMYDETIAGITDIENIVEESNNTAGEIHYTQNIDAVIMNGPYKGNEVSFVNHTSSSGVFSEQLDEHSEVFVELSEDGQEVVSLLNVKRDKYLVILLVIFIDTLLLIAKKRGFIILLSLLASLAITAVSVFLYDSFYDSINIVALYSGIAVAFIVVTLLMTNGRGAKTNAAILSSVISLFATFGIAFLVITLFGEGAPYWTMDYIDAIYDSRNYIFVGVLLCGLGAIMDVSITMSSSINELVTRDPDISRRRLIRSGQEIARDITGTMVNVMLYTMYVSIIPTVLLAIKNGAQLFDAISFYGYIELVLVLVSCIGIVLTIPVSLKVSVYLLHDRRKGGADL